MTKVIRKNVCVNKKIKDEFVNLKNNEWAIFRLCSYNQIYLYNEFGNFDTLEKAQDFMEKEKMSVGRYIILQIGNINEIQNKILNENKVKQKEYAYIYTQWGVEEYRGIITACDIKQAKDKIGMYNGHVIPLVKGKIPINKWKRNMVEKYIKTDEIGLIKRSLNDIKPTNEQFVAEAL